MLAIFPEQRDRSAKRERLTISSVGRMSQANNGKQSSSPLALSLFLCRRSIFLGKQSQSRQRAASLSHHDLTFEKQTRLVGEVGVKRQ